MTFLLGKVALVTGGASGIGLEITKNFLENGVKGVGIVDITEDNGKEVEKDLQKAFGNKVIFIKADVTIQDEFEDAFKKTIYTFKNLDIVVNNAGILNELQWERAVAVNLEGVIRGTYLAMDKYLPWSKSGDEGVILNTASILGLNTIGSIPTYCATKHGVVGLGKSLATDNIHITKKVRLMTFCPGLIATPLSKASNLLVKDVERCKQELSAVSEKVSSPKYVGKSVVKIVNEGTHGSVWVVEDEKPPYEVSFPYRTNLRKL